MAGPWAGPTQKTPQDLIQTMVGVGVDEVPKSPPGFCSHEIQLYIDDPSPVSDLRDRLVEGLDSYFCLWEEPMLVSRVALHE